jgi:hypothetical protein
MPASKGYSSSVLKTNWKYAQERSELPFRGAVFSKVTSVSANQEEVSLDGSVGEQANASFAYPFATRQSWIRGMPEPGTTILSVIGADSKVMQPIGYVEPLKKGDVLRYNDLAFVLRNDLPLEAIPQIIPYRNIQAAEIDAGSRFAQSFLGMDDANQQRGGLTHWLLTSQKAELDTALFIVNGAHHAVGLKLNDEARFGTVRRAKSDTFSTLPDLVKIQDQYAKESTQILTWKGTPNTLIDHRAGNVVEDDGTTATSTTTGINLRARYQFYTFFDKTEATVDELGHFNLLVSSDATGTNQVNFLQSGLLLSAQTKVVLRSGDNFSISTRKTFNMDASTGFRIATPQTGNVSADSGLTLKSNSFVKLNTPVNLGVKVTSGLEPSFAFPVLVANPTYIETLNSFYGRLTAMMSQIINYGASTASSWSAVAAVVSILDPSGTTSSLCLKSGVTGAALASEAGLSSAALASHLATLTQNPGGFISVRTESE